MLIGRGKVGLRGGSRIPQGPMTQPRRGGQKRSQDGLKMAQEGLKMQDGMKMVQNDPRRPQDSSKLASKGLKKASKEQSWHGQNGHPVEARSKFSKK